MNSLKHSRHDGGSLLRINKAALLTVLLAMGVTGAGSVSAAVVNFSQPDFDRWNYPFNSTPGIRPSALTFSAVGNPQFDNRDGQLLIGFDTSAVMPGLSPGFSYRINSISATATHSLGAFEYDPTYDTFASHLDPLAPGYVADTDIGRPVELVGAGFRKGFTSFSFGPTNIGTPEYEENENFGGTLGVSIRNVYAATFDGGGALIDISNQVDDSFDITPFAVGTTNLTPGDAVVQSVAGVSPGSTFTFDLDVSNPDVRGYIQDGLADGGLFFSITSLHPASQQAGGAAPNWYTRDSFDPAAIAPTLAIDFDVVLNGDLDGDGFVGIGDLNIVLGNWNQAVPPGDPLADASGDGFVGIDDLNFVLGNWNAGTPPASEVVPEPAGLTILVITGLPVLVRRLNVRATS
jgi:hypothetical protein